ncbi:MAG TPA: hypothetical protein DIT63_05175, partial [Gammaproteobacteria bacterium]|nr:hypothetical protein [Gammaproteobacteria bacterium]
MTVTRSKPTLMCTLDGPLKPMVQARLGELAHVRFLDDVPAVDRREALAQAQVLLCLRPQLEMGDDWPPAPQWQFVQFMSAGVDHIDLSKFPSACLMASNAGGFSEPMAEHILAMALALSKKLL